MPEPIQPPPTWFLKFWEANCTRLPMILRGESSMIMAWGLFKLLIDHLGAYANTPAGIEMVVAFAKIQAMMVESRIIANAPNPSPAQVTEAVQRLVEKAKRGREVEMGQG